MMIYNEVPNTCIINTVRSAQPALLMTMLETV